MFELTKKAEYGLQLMVYLADKYDQGNIPLKQISKAKDLPYRFLSQIAAELKKSGLLDSKEGLGGGYFLTRSPQEISVAEILETLEGPIELVECLKREASCPWAEACGQKQMFEQMKGKLKNIIGAHSLGDLI
jgi:Rrf2 family protein